MDTEIVIVKPEPGIEYLSPENATTSHDPKCVRIKEECLVASDVCFHTRCTCDFIHGVTVRKRNSYPSHCCMNSVKVAGSMDIYKHITQTSKIREQTLLITQRLPRLGIEPSLIDVIDNQIDTFLNVKIEPRDENSLSPTWNGLDQQQKIETADYGHNIVPEVPFTGQSFFESAIQLASGVIVPEHFLNYRPQADDTTNYCTICEKTFKTSFSLQRHLSLHKRPKHTCNTCNKEFYKIEQLEKHLNKHRDKNERIYPCDVCDKRFKSTSNLHQHKRVHLSVKPFVCELCQKTFTNRAHLRRHQGKSRCKKPIDGPLFCHVCKKEFQKEFLLKSHLKKHTTEKPYICDLCGMNFKYKSAIIRHLQWHTGYRPYKCKFCDKQFTHSGLIKPHLRVHTGEKPYQCSICLKHFAHKHNMERHKINHGRIKRLVCEVCNKKFPRESRLIYHMRTHTNEKHFVCHVCDRRFSHKQNTIRHYERKHPGLTYNGTDTDAKVALKVWDKVKHTLEPHFDMYQQPEEIIG